MKTYLSLFLALVCFSVLLSGCNNNNGSGGSTQVTDFIVVPNYGSPGAYSIDTLTPLFGGVVGGYSCDTSTDSNCILSFGPAYASTTANPAGYTEYTDAVNGVDWNLYGNSSSNCSAGYPATIFTVYTMTSYPLTCASPTTNFLSSNPSWHTGQQPASVTYTAVNTTFPAQNFSTATTVYDTSANVQWSGTVVSSSNTQITVPISDVAVGKHILVFRNPTNNSVIGSSAYVVFAQSSSGPPGGGCTKQPCTEQQSN